MPTAITATITAILIATMTLLTRADSDTPRISSSDTQTITNAAGRLTSPAAVPPPARCTVSYGEAHSRDGSETPKLPSSLTA